MTAGGEPRRTSGAPAAGSNVGTAGAGLIASARVSVVMCVYLGDRLGPSYAAIDTLTARGASRYIATNLQ